MMAVINFETAVYWGQLTKCHALVYGHDSHYSCKNTAAYGAVCAFAVLIMLCQILFAYGLSIWRFEYFDDNSAVKLNDGVHSDSSGV